MDNRKPPTDRPSADSNQNKIFRAADDKKSFGAGNVRPREGSRFLPERGGAFQKRDENFRPREESGGDIKNNGGGQNAPNREREFKPRNERQTGRDEKFQPAERRFPAGVRRGKFQPSDEKRQPSNRKFPATNRFAPKDKNFRSHAPQNRRETPPPPRIISDLQVTDGKHRGKYLARGASPKLRPTERRAREVMFRILFRRVRAGRFLDLCAGSGMVGIEAISRGALLGTFVERSARLCSVIKKNLETCGIKTGHGEVVQIEAAPFLKQAEKRRRRWDVVFFDPPFDANYDEVLDFFARGAALKTGGALVIEHHAEMFFPETFGAMHRWRVLVQGETALSFYERK